MDAADTPPVRQSDALSAHRHAVFAPTLAFALLLSLAMTRGPSTRIPMLPGSAIQTSAREERVQDLAPGVQALVLGGSRVVAQADGPVLEHGSFLVAGRDAFAVRTGAWTIEGWDGGFFLAAQGERVTVAALTTPVFVRREETTVLVPAFTQWRSTAYVPAFNEGMEAWLAARAPMPLPRAFVEEQMVRLARLDPPDRGAPAPVTEFLASVIDPVVQLPAARDQAQQTRAQRDAWRTLAFLRSGDVHAAMALLTQDAVAAYIASDAARTLRAKLFSETLLSAPATATILRRITLPPDELALARFHPQLRDSAWSLVDGESDLGEVTVLSLLLLPGSDQLPIALSPVAWKQWEAAALSTLDALPSSYAALLLAQLQGQFRWSSHGEYAQRSDRTARAATAVAARTKGPLPEEALAFVREAQNAGVLTIAPLEDGNADRTSEPVDTPSPSAHAVSVSSVPAAVVFSSGDVTDRAHTILANAGGMFIPQTAIRPIDGSRARIEDIVFATAAGDERLTLTLDVHTDEVSAVLLRGTAYPYAVPLAQFMRWLSASH